MQGDKIIVEEHHLDAAKCIVPSLLPSIKRSETKFAITVAGESGSGKSETASAIADCLKNAGIAAIIFQQDDYFIHPPKSNDAVRRKDIKWVGTGEVKLQLLSSHIRAFKNGKEHIDKPLIDYSLNTIVEERFNFDNAQVAIIEGTYTSLLTDVDARIFIARDFNQTLNHRKKRNRDASELDTFTENVLKIEHDIISKHLSLADIIINHDYSVHLNPDR